MCWRNTERSRARRRLPTTACWRGGSWSAACGLCSCSIGAGFPRHQRRRGDRVRTDQSLQNHGPTGGRADQRPEAARHVDETLVVWTGEFGRTPFREGRTKDGKFLGRDHHPFSNTMFMAGAGLKPGVSYGATDELGWGAGREAGSSPRPASHDFAPVGVGSHAADLSVPGAGFPPDRCPRRRRSRYLGVTRGSAYRASGVLMEREAKELRCPRISRRW